MKFARMTSVLTIARLTEKNWKLESRQWKVVLEQLATLISLMKSRAVA